MSIRKGLACIAWLIPVCTLALRPAFADSLSHQSDRRCDESLGQGEPSGDFGPQEIEPAVGPESPPSEPIPPVPAPPPVSQPSMFVLWPMEYVLRPQTLPEGTVELGTTARVFRPQSGRLTAADGSSYTFNSNLSFGLWARKGITDRLEIGFTAPQVLCRSRSEPSGCSDINRYNGTGPNLAYGVLRTRAFQLMLFGDIGIARSAKPVKWAWELGARGKLLLGQVVSVEAALAVSRRIDSGSSQTDSSARGSAVLEMNLQATRHLVFFASANPYAPTDHLAEPVLEVRGGASWTFRNLSEIIASAGTNNAFAKRSWNDYVPGSLYRLSMLFWF
jgi:hypothetical protein